MKQKQTQDLYYILLQKIVGIPFIRRNFVLLLNIYLDVFSYLSNFLPHVFSYLYLVICHIFRIEKKKSCDG